MAFKGPSRDSGPHKGKGDTNAAILVAFTAGGEHDKIRVTLQGGESLKLQFTMGAPVLKFFRLLNQRNKEAGSKQASSNRPLSEPVK